MASSEEIEKLLENLRTPSEKKTIFEDSLEDAWSIFQFDGKPSLPAFEAFLIAAVSRCFEKADRDSNQAKSRDACLVGLGLLKECYHTNAKEGISTHISVEERYISYLQGDYIELMRPHYKKGDNLDPSDRESKPRRALERSDARARKRLAEHLASQVGYNAAYQASVGKHTGSNKTSEEEKQLEIILPEPCYTLENFTPVSQSKSKPEPQPEPETKPEPNSDRIRRQRNVAIALSILFLILLCRATWFRDLEYKISNEKDDVRQIILSENEITVKPGIPEKLEPTVIPIGAGIDGLECEPENKNLVKVEKRAEDFRVIVNDGWQEETDYITTLKVYVKNDTSVYAEATVTVEPPAHISDPSPSDIMNPVLGGSIEKNADSSWND